MKYFIIIITLLICFCISCKKKTSEPPPEIVNEVTASFVFSDTVVNLSEIGGETAVGCTSIYAKTEGISASFNINVCATTPGSYTNEFTSLLATFRGDYTRTITSPPGSITFTKIDNNIIEGYFNIVCYNVHSDIDSVKVSGSFKREIN
jgi:hypothetical protein